MRVDRISGADVKKLAQSEKTQRKVQAQSQQIQSEQMNRMRRNETERAIDRMARMSSNMKKRSTNRISTFYKAVQKSMVDFMG